MKLRFLLSHCLLLAIAPSANALVDSNGNGMSDIWEKDHNQGNLFPSTFDPQSDEDADGWTNAVEAVAGTDPYEANRTGGFIRPQLKHHHAIFTTGEDGPELLSPEAYTLTWPSRIGKQYTILFSADMTPGSWIPLGPPVTATGTEAVVGMPITQPDGSTPPAIFWRIVVNDTDSDGDTLSDHEEHQLGTDPLLTDSNDDGIPDSAAAPAYSGNPWEGFPGTSNPPGGSSPAPDPLYMNYSRKYYGEFCDTYPTQEGEEPTYFGQTYKYSDTINDVVTDDPANYSTNLNTSETAITDGLDGIQYPDFPTVDADKMQDAIALAMSGAGIDAYLRFDSFEGYPYSFASGEMASSRFRLERLTAEDTKRSLTYLKLRHSGWMGKLTNVETFKLTIPPNMSHSNEVELKTEVNDEQFRIARFSITDNRVATGVDNISNTAAEEPGSGYQEHPWIMAPCGDTVTQGGMTFSMTNDFSFSIGAIVPGSLEVTCPEVTVQDPHFSYIDWQYPMKSSFKGSGNATSEQTPVFKFGAGADQISVELPVRVKTMKKRKVRVALWPVRQNGETEIPISQSLRLKIGKKLDEVFAYQINAWFEVSYQTGQQADLHDSTETLDLGNGSQVTLGITHANGQKEKAAIASLMTSTADINAFLITTDSYRLPVGAEALTVDGYSYPSQDSASGIHKNSCVIKRSGSEDEITETLAHEIGHLLVGSGHPDQLNDSISGSGGPAPLRGLPLEEQKKRLMCSGTVADGSSKLLVKAEWDEAEKWLIQTVDQ